MVSLIKTIFRGKQDKVRHTFTDEDREKSKLGRQAREIKKKRFEILHSRLQNLKDKMEENHLLDQIEHLEGEFFDQEEDPAPQNNENVLSPEEKFGFKLLENYLIPKGAAAPGDLPEFQDKIQDPVGNPPQDPQGSLNEKEIRDLIKKLPLGAKAYIKHTDNATLIRMLELIKNE